MVCPLVCLSVLKYLSDSAKDFSNFLHEVSAPQGYKSDRAQYLTKNLGGLQKGENPLFGAFLMFFVHISKTAPMILMKFCVETVLIDT